MQNRRNCTSSMLCFLTANTTRRDSTITYPGQQHTWECLHIDNVLNDYQWDNKWADKQMIIAFFFIKRNCGKIFRRGEGKSYKNDFVICECLQQKYFISVTISLNMGGICRRRWSQFVVAKGYNIPELHKHLS